MRIFIWDKAAPHGSFMRGLTDRALSLGERGSDRLREAYCAPADMPVPTLCHCGRRRGFLKLKEADPDP